MSRRGGSEYARPSGLNLDAPAGSQAPYGDDRNQANRS